MNAFQVADTEAVAESGQDGDDRHPADSRTGPATDDEDAPGKDQVAQSERVERDYPGRVFVRHAKHAKARRKQEQEGNMNGLDLASITPYAAAPKPGRTAWRTNIGSRTRS